jgi:hypothetical protein
VLGEETGTIYLQAVVGSSWIFLSTSYTTAVINP